MATEVFPFAFEDRYAWMLRPLGVRPDNSRVTVTDEGFEAVFGRWSLRTPWTNVKDVQITRDYHWFKAIGPRGSFADRGVTMGSSTEAGVCICFHEPVSCLLPRPRFPHPGLTVTVEDCEGLAAEVRRRASV